WCSRPWRILRLRERWLDSSRFSFIRSIISDNRHKRLDKKEQYRRAIEVLREGGVAAMPTDTVFGLIAVATDDGAVRRVFEIKGRASDQPLPLFVGSTEQADGIGELTD